MLNVMWQLTDIVVPDVGDPLMVVTISAGCRNQVPGLDTDVHFSHRFEVWLPSALRSLDEIHAQAFAELRAQWPALTAALHDVPTL